MSWRRSRTRVQESNNHGRSQLDDDFLSLVIDLACTDEFLDFARESLQHRIPSKRPRLSKVLEHPFFSRDYLSIASFLADLPVKSEVQKKTFFTALTEKLFHLPNETFSLQLSAQLLSRYVLLDPTARDRFIPNLVTPAKGESAK